MDNKKVRLAILGSLLVLAIVTAAFAWQRVPKTGGVSFTGENGLVLADPSGRVTLIDLGAEECPPCKVMAPIIEELQSEYAGRADIIFIDVWKDPAQAKQFNVKAVPTQIFFDVDGREVFRHVGFLDKRTIVGALEQMGVPRRE